MRRHDFDTPWKEALAKHLREFFTFFFPDIEGDIDWSRRVKFLDKELRRIAPDSKTGGRITDTLVEVHRQGGKTTWVLVHIEVQSQVDQGFAQRMLTYHTRITQHHQEPVCSLAILGDPRQNWRPSFHENSLWGTKLRFEFPMVKLLDLRCRLPELECSRNPFALLVAATLHAQSAGPGSNERREAKWGVA